MSTAADTVSIEAWLDVSCSYSFGATRTIPLLLEELADDADAPMVELTFRPVRLHDTLPAEGERFDIQMGRYIEDAEQLAAVKLEIEEYNLRCGTEVQLEPSLHLSHPLLAHRLIALARTEPDVDMWALAQTIWAAQWHDGIDVSDPDTLRAYIDANGPSLAESIWQQLSVGAGTDLVAADRQRATDIALDGVPRLYVSRGVSGTIVPAWLDLDDVRDQLHTAIKSAH